MVGGVLYQVALDLVFYVIQSLPTDWDTVFLAETIQLDDDFFHTVVVHYSLFRPVQRPHN